MINESLSEKVFDRLFAILEEMGIPSENIKLESHLEDDLGIDSTELVEFSVAIEKEFNVDIERKDLDNMETIKDIVTYLLSHPLTRLS